MKLKDLTLPAILMLFIASCSSYKQADRRQHSQTAQDIYLKEDVRQYFDNCGVDGSIAIYDVKKERWMLSDTAGIDGETLPASTFKIINLLVALETNTIVDENEVVNWVGGTDTVKYGYRPDIYHDMSVKEAFDLSAGWVFVELAKKIGKDKYREYLTKCRYGNGNLSQTEPDFWNFGDFGISPKNQVEFLLALYQERLPFSRRNIEIVKNVMITEQTDDYTIRAKTGWTRENNMNIGWWVGYVETKKGAYIFATRLLQDRKLKRADFGNCRKEISKKVFRDLGII